MEQNQSAEVTLVIPPSILAIMLVVIVSVSFLVYKMISFRTASSSTNYASQTTATEVVTEENGKQVITIKARGGYSPRTVAAKSGLPTVLRMRTSNSYGCERSFSIPKMGIQQSLPSTGDTDIDLGTPEKGSKIFGTCSMGMYTLSITFN